MTPKEKAKELYLKMLKFQSKSNLYIERNILCPTAKHCARIAVEEILSEPSKLYFLFIAIPNFEDIFYIKIVYVVCSFYNFFWFAKDVFSYKQLSTL